MQLHRTSAFIRLPALFRILFVSAIFAAAIAVPRAASSQISRVGAVNSLATGTPIPTMLGTDVAYDPINQVYLVVVAYGKTYGQFINENGSANGQPFRIGNSDGGCPPGFANYPRVTYSSDVNNGNGGFLITWHQEANCSPSSSRINSILAAYPGGVISTQRTLSGTGTRTTQGAAIAYSKTSQRFLVVWSTVSGTIDGVGVGTDGAPISSVATIVSAPNGNGTSAQHPSLTWNSQTNEFGLGFAGYDPPFVGFRRVNAATGAVSTTPVFGFSGSGTFSTAVDFNPTTGNFVMGWTIGAGNSRAAEISPTGTVLATGLLSSRLGSPNAFSMQINPASGTALAISEDCCGEVAALEMNGNGSPNTVAAAVTSGAASNGGSFFPRLTTHSSSKQWAVSYSQNLNRLANQIVATTSSNGGGSGTFDSPPPTGGGGGGGGGASSYTLTITPPTGGTIITAGITCGVGGTTCTTTYSSGFPVALTANAAAGYTFGGWTGDCAPNGTTSMTANRTCGATFNSTGGGGGTTYALTVTPPTGGTLTTAGINCGVGGATCSATFASGFQVTLTATAASGYTFGSWGGSCSPNGSTTMTQNRTCSATFNPTGGGGGGTGPYTLSITSPTGGRITTAGINCGLGSTTCSTQYFAGFPVALTATAGAGYTFGGWTGDCASNGTTSMTQNRTCGAVFNSIGGGGGTFTLTVTPPTGGTLTTAGINCGVGGSTCSSSYASGFQVALTATAAAGYTFGSWTGDCASGGITTMSQNRSCSATFNATGGGGGGNGPFTLTITNPALVGGVGGIISGAGIQCYPGGVGFCTRTSISAGTNVALTAIPNAASVFTGWSGTGCGNLVTMGDNRVCTPLFGAKP